VKRRLGEQLRSLADRAWAAGRKEQSTDLHAAARTAERERQLYERGKAPPLVTKSGRVLTDADIQAMADEALRGYPTDDRLARLQIEAQRAERLGQLTVTLLEFKIIIAELLLRRHGIDPDKP